MGIRLCLELDATVPLFRGGNPIKLCKGVRKPAISVSQQKRRHNPQDMAFYRGGVPWSSRNFENVNAFSHVWSNPPWSPHGETRAEEKKKMARCFDYGEQRFIRGDKVSRHRSETGIGGKKGARVGQSTHGIRLIDTGAKERLLK